MSPRDSTIFIYFRQNIVSYAPTENENKLAYDLHLRRQKNWTDKKELIWVWSVISQLIFDKNAVFWKGKKTFLLLIHTFAHKYGQKLVIMDES